MASYYPVTLSGRYCTSCMVFFVQATFTRKVKVSHLAGNVLVIDLSIAIDYLQAICCMGFFWLKHGLMNVSGDKID